MTVIESIVGPEKVDSSGREVHDKLAYGLWDCDGGGGFAGSGDGAAADLLAGDGDGVLFGGGESEDIVCGPLDELMSILAEWADVSVDLDAVSRNLQQFLSEMREFGRLCQIIAPGQRQFHQSQRVTYVDRRDI